MREKINNREKKGRETQRGPFEWCALFVIADVLAAGV